LFKKVLKILKDFAGFWWSL